MYNIPMETPGEKCGVFGIYGKGMDVSRLTFFGLYALQHRGQESSGIAAADGEKIQPIETDGSVVLSHNGNLPSTKALEKFLEKKKVTVSYSSDSRLITEA